jgi:Ricin-type beta-trefoil lectin domain
MSIPRSPTSWPTRRPLRRVLSIAARAPAAGEGLRACVHVSSNGSGYPAFRVDRASNTKPNVDHYDPLLRRSFRVLCYPAAVQVRPVSTVPRLARTALEFPRDLAWMWHGRRMADRRFAVKWQLTRGRSSTAVRVEGLRSSGAYLVAGPVSCPHSLAAAGQCSAVKGLVMPTETSPIVRRLVAAKGRKRRGHTALTVGLSGLCALALAGTMTATQASADSSVSFSVYNGIIRNWATGVCLDANANVNPCYNYGADAYQQWAVGEYWEYPWGFNYIGNLRTGACLENQWTGLDMAACSPNDPAQEWMSVGDSYQGYFVNVLTGLCLDNNGTSLYTLPCDFGGSQTWRWDGSM